ncbi:MAG: hypothetical protein P8Q85_03565 [Candidatus Poseidoniaceae archaeon]|uniref:hypothetical protein n=1 Tax=Poseidonia sp. TaxID=2666344 RepID=UPI003F69F21F|nr:hypothetical protein [Candidatus Poseidoniaceae archaeon]MDG1557588.1 hypothetical protein [Candidatus Poseidoniaceae archaeon]MDG1558527.1 hypothetical protein [Candidatus Poseidoniaceae archaeon]
MTTLYPQEELLGIEYLLAAMVCWTSPLWFDTFRSEVVNPLMKWIELGLLVF